MSRYSRSNQTFVSRDITLFEQRNRGIVTVTVASVHVDTALYINDHIPGIETSLIIKSSCLQGRVLILLPLYIGTGDTFREFLSASGSIIHSIRFSVEINDLHGPFFMNELTQIHVNLGGYSLHENEVQCQASSRRSTRPQANFLYDEPSGGFKKRRLGRACDLCRQKQILPLMARFFFLPSSFLPKHTPTAATSYKVTYIATFWIDLTPVGTLPTMSIPTIVLYTFVVAKETADNLGRSIVNGQPSSDTKVEFCSDQSHNVYSMDSDLECTKHKPGDES
ncbi:hypothetical protein K435DRAFT_839463 [Dendrothele bispora CBS 962.96]|uniref:Uncharacterized protein n=1 Tax=Dendrothele bispora (strain CBS 962.96) TaxID=1314807 RepID=A0A4S8M139_DENBC|nr:hypothetical protein K435DRAFT_839463 [Dendrothele bispora CBS 962.96]